MIREKKSTLNLSFYQIAVIFISIGIFLKLPGYIGKIDFLFQVGLVCSAIGVVFLLYAIVKKKR